MKVKNYQTKEEDRDKVGKILSQHLFNFLSVSMDLKQSHWMARGIEFKSLHSLFDELHQMVENNGDIIAERMIQLGYPTSGSIQSIAENTSFERFNEKLTDGVQLCELCLNRISILSSNIQADISKIENLDDKGSVDILTKISLDLDKAKWELEATVNK